MVTSLDRGRGRFGGNGRGQNIGRNWNVLILIFILISRYKMDKYNTNII